MFKRGDFVTLIDLPANMKEYEGRVATVVESNYVIAFNVYHYLVMLHDTKTPTYLTVVEGWMKG